MSYRTGPKLLVETRWKRAYKQASPKAGSELARQVTDAIDTTVNDVVDCVAAPEEKWQDRWEIFVFGVKYSCNVPKKSCDWTRDRFENRQELRRHFVAKHGFKRGSAEIETALDGAGRCPIRESAAQNKKVEGMAVSTRSTVASR